MRLWIVVPVLIGILGLLAALHHVVVISAQGTAFANAFAPTCAMCHAPSDPAAR